MLLSSSVLFSSLCSFVIFVLSVVCALASTDILCFFFLMIRRPPRSTLDRSSAASDVYKRQPQDSNCRFGKGKTRGEKHRQVSRIGWGEPLLRCPVSYTHLRAHETVLDLVCRLLLEKKTKHTETVVYPENIHNQRTITH